MFVITLILLLTNFAIYAGTGMSAAELIWNLVRYVVPTFFLPILTGILIMALDKRPIKPMIKGLLCYPLFLGSWLVINFKCLFKNFRSKWWRRKSSRKSLKRLAFMPKIGYNIKSITKTEEWEQIPLLISI